MLRLPSPLNRVLQSQIFSYLNPIHKQDSYSAFIAVHYTFIAHVYCYYTLGDSPPRLAFIIQAFSSYPSVGYI